ncbi:MAG: hypothetical protein WBF55_16215, partial [Syntrophobacteria bacterium]
MWADGDAAKEDKKRKALCRLSVVRSQLSVAKRQKSEGRGQKTEVNLNDFNYFNDLNDGPRTTDN